MLELLRDLPWIPAYDRRDALVIAEVLMVLYEVPPRKLAAAQKIQAFWRGYRERAARTARLQSEDSLQGKDSMHRSRVSQAGGRSLERVGSGASERSLQSSLASQSHSRGQSRSHRRQRAAWSPLWSESLAWDRVSSDEFLRALALSLFVSARQAR